MTAVARPACPAVTTFPGDGRPLGRGRRCGHLDAAKQLPRCCPCPLERSFPRAPTIGPIQCDRSAEVSMKRWSRALVRTAPDDGTATSGRNWRAICGMCGLFSATPHWITMQPRHCRWFHDRGQFGSLYGSNCPRSWLADQHARNTRLLYANRCINIRAESPAIRQCRVFLGGACRGGLGDGGRGGGQDVDTTLRLERLGAGVSRWRSGEGLAVRSRAGSWRGRARRGRPGPARGGGARWLGCRLR